MPMLSPCHSPRAAQALSGAFALMLACSSTLAEADPSNPCNVPASTPRQAYVDVLQNGGGFGCAPFPVGNGSMPTLRSNAAGSVAWWYCPAPEGKWRLNWAAGTAASLSGKNLYDDAYKVITAPNSRAAFDEVSAHNVRLPLSDPQLTPVWCPFVGEMLAGAPKTPSAPTTPTPARGTP